VEDHRIHTEYCQLPAEVADQLNCARAEGRRIIAVGTTSVRVLETAARAGKQIAPYSGWTDLFIYPGYPFRAVDVLITNFHLPRSTLLLLVAAFAGKDTMDRAYQEAIREEYRFYSFGDCMLIL
jgi:S-adenosylmethionine:tRNA ribosyltransferase-isomerase